MELSRYRIWLTVRIILLLINLLAISVLVVHLKWFFTSVIIAVILILQIIDFFRFSFRIKYDLDNLIKSFEQGDLSSEFYKTDYKPKFKESEDSLHRIKTIVKNSRIEKEVQFNFLKILIENVPSGILVIKNNSLFLSNKAAGEILQLKELISINILRTNYPEFYEIIKTQKSISSELISLTHNNTEIQLSFSINQIVLLKEKAKIVNFQNIKTALEKNELLAWNKLIRTMTHEIMNSVTPLISLSETGYSIISEDNKPKAIKNINQKNIEHIHKSFKSIYNKSVWLKNFVDDYRKLIRIPQPKKSNFSINLFIDEIIEQTSLVFKEENITVVNNTQNIEIFADKNLIELVIINLIKNAIDSLKQIEKKQIQFESKQLNDSVYLSITDNGEGISKDIIDQIFIPFFSTKESGSGIGLSVVRQIMQMHGGRIEVLSDISKTRFTLVFQNT